MSGSAKSRINHTLLCLIAVYGIHAGILFHVLSSPPVLVTSVIVKPSYLKSIISRSRKSSHSNFNNQSFPAVNNTKKNVSVHSLVTYNINIRNNVDALIRNKLDSSPSEVPLKENLLLEKRGNAYKDSSVPEDEYLLNLISWSTASGTLSIITLAFSEVKVLKILSPSAWGVIIGCLIFLFTSSDCEKRIEFQINYLEKNKLKR